MRDVLHISELAALIGKNKYKTPDEAKVNIFKRLRPAMYDQAAARTKTQIVSGDQLVESLKLDLSAAVTATQEQAATARATQIIATTPLISASQRTIDKVTQTLMNADALPEQQLTTRLLEQMASCAATAAPGCSITASAQQRLANAATQLVSNTNKTPVPQTRVATFIQTLKVADCPQATAQVEATVNKRRGTRNEHPAIDMYERQTNTKVAGNNARFYMCNVGSVSHPCYIGGYVDGLRGDRVIEVKCRRNRLFNWLPAYEKVQITAYMHVAGKPKCDLVQKFGAALDIKTYEFDAVYWNQITTDICAAWTSIQRLFSNYKEQDRLLRTVAAVSN